MAVPHFRDVIVAVLPVQAIDLATPLYIEQYPLQLGENMHGGLNLRDECKRRGGKQTT